ncbi:MAG: GNAT family N-acetyltransferase [Acidobacteriota bacterium]|nr:GNAT family N-acetyltransferase [Acidobacteriota bacterium]
MIEVSFDAAGLGDVSALAEMMRAFNELEHIRFDEAEVRAALAHLLGDESLGRVWLMRSGAEVVGYVVLTFGFSLEFRGRDAIVDELFVREEWRGRGAGRQALEFVAGFCRARGARALHLEVERANTAAQTLYRKAGFLDHGRHLLTKWL